MGTMKVVQETTRAALEDILDAFKQGDTDRLATRYHDDIDWLFYAPVALFPFAGARRGKADVFKGYALMYDIFSLSSYNVAVKLVDGDRAATLSDAHMVQRATGRTIRSRVAGFHRFRDGRLIEYRGFTDSFDSVEQALGRELQI
jgi:ketosteroid isomerase-like protein